MDFENEFVVAAPADRTWTALLDVERVATCLPGATMEPADAEGAYKGAMRVRVGPMTMSYTGTARIESADPEARIAVFAVDGREVRGQGSAAARITSTLTPEDGGTRVVVGTAMQLSGRAAQFGRGIVQDVAAAMLSDFAVRLSEMLAHEAGETDAPAITEAPAPGAEPLKLTGVLGKVALHRLATWTGIAWLRQRLRRDGRPEGQG